MMPINQEAEEAPKEINVNVEFREDGVRQKDSNQKEILKKTKTLNEEEFGKL